MERELHDRPALRVHSDHRGGRALGCANAAGPLPDRRRWPLETVVQIQSLDSRSARLVLSRTAARSTLRCAARATEHPAIAQRQRRALRTRAVREHVLAVRLAAPELQPASAADIAGPRAVIVVRGLRTIWKRLFAVIVLNARPEQRLNQHDAPPTMQSSRTRKKIGRVSGGARLYSQLWSVLIRCPSGRNAQGRWPSFSSCLYEYA